MGTIQDWINQRFPAHAANAPVTHAAVPAVTNETANSPVALQQGVRALNRITTDNSAINDAVNAVAMYFETDSPHRVDIVHLDRHSEQTDRAMEYAADALRQHGISLENVSPEERHQALMYVVLEGAREETRRGGL